MSKIEASEQRLTNKIETSEHRLELKIANMQAEMLVLKWMTGANLAFVLAVLVKLFIK